MSCKSILVIEDDADIRESLKLALEIEGYTVFTACQGQEGLDVFDTIPTPCAILLDLMMPVMDGFEFLTARKAREGLSRVPVVVVSAFPEKAKKIEVQGYIKKPVNLDDLFSAISKHCA